MKRNTGPFKKWGFLIYATAMVLTALFPAFAQEVKEIKPIIVTATKLEEPLEEVPSSVTIVKEGEVETRQLRNVEEALRTVPGLDVQRSGSLGKVTTLRIRGANPKQVQVLIDGVRVKSTTTGDFDFSGLTLDNVERIEVVRGPQSTLYGADAIGGVINIITKRGVGKPKYTISMEGGNYETLRERATMDGTKDRLDYSLSLSRTDTDGQFNNDQHSNSSLSGRLGFAVSERTRLFLITRYSRAEKGLPFRTIFPVFDPDRYQKDSLFLIKAQGEQSLFSWWDHRLSVSVVDSDLNFEDPPSPGQPTGEDSRIDVNRNEMEWQHNFYISEGNTWTFGLEFRDEKGRNFSNSELKFDKTVTTRSLFAQNQVRFWERLFITLGLRADDNSAFGTEITPRAAIAYLFKETGTKLKGSYGEGFRAPTLNELYYPGFGNPDLRPEESRSWEGGLEQRVWGDKGFIGVTYFRNDFRELIEYRYDPGTGQYLPSNVSRARTQGVELELGLEPVKGMEFNANYTYLDAKDRITHQELRRFSRNRWNFLVTYRFMERFTVSTAVFIVSSQFESPSLGRNPGYTKVDLSASYDIGKVYGDLGSLQAFARVDNLFDEDYQEVYGYPALGINFLMGLKVKF